MNNNFTLNIKDVTKKFGRRLVFTGISGEFKTNDVLGLKGKNGSGKSTLSKLLIGIDSPNSGTIEHYSNNKKIEAEKIHDFVGFASPYLNLYNEFSALENLELFSKIRGLEFNHKWAENLFERFNLSKRKNDLLKAYSSGMLQRMKIISAVFHQPEFLLLDEPVSNLDNAGKSEVYELIREFSSKTLIVIASNEDSDLELCTKFIEIENYK